LAEYNDDEAPSAVVVNAVVESSNGEAKRNTATPNDAFLLFPPFFLMRLYEKEKKRK